MLGDAQIRTTGRNGKTYPARNRCGVCGQLGHNSKTCSRNDETNESEELNGDE